jgi:dephospho-CoA kinase
MASMVFANPEKLKKLESILHPLIRSEVRRIQTELKNRGELVAFYDVPLLFEKNMQDQFDAILVVAATKDQQLERRQVRDQWTPEQINQRLANQLDLQQKKAQADYVILNTGSLKDLETQVEQVLIKMGLGKK